MSARVGPWGPLRFDTPRGVDRARERRDSILDAAQSLFVSQGLSGTSMAQLASAAGISRVLLYRHFSNREEVMNALITREAQRILSELDQVPWPADPVQGCIDYIGQAMVVLRSNEFLQTLLRVEPAQVLPFLTTEGGPLLRVVTEWVTTQLGHWSALPTDKREQLAEILTRFVFSTALTPAVTIDFDDSDTRDRVIRAVVSGLIEHL